MITMTKMNSDDVNDHIDSNNDTSNSTNINSISIIILFHINIISLIILLKSLWIHNDDDTQLIVSLSHDKSLQPN